MPNAMVNSNIPMSAGMPQIVTPVDLVNAKRMQYDAQMDQLRLQEAQRQVQSQNAMRGILGQPGAITQQGISPNAMADLARIDPTAAIGLQNTTLNAQRTRELINEAKAKAAADEAKASKERYDNFITKVSPVMRTMVDQYDAAVRRGDDPNVVKQSVWQNGMKMIDDLEKSGILDAQEVKMARTAQFDPAMFRVTLAMADAKKNQTGPTAELGRAKRALQAGQITKEEYDRIVAKETGSGGLSSFSKELIDSGIKPGSKEWSDLWKKRIEKETSPTQTMIDLRGMMEAAKATQTGVTGEEFLKTLPAAKAAQVKALSEGRMPMPSGFALRSPYWQNMLTAVAQYDPTFDVAKYPQRMAVRKDFTSGQAARNVTAINTAIGHMGTMYDLADALQNKNIRLVNQLVNRVATETGNPKVANFEIAKGAVANELMRVFRQVGASESEMRDWEKRFTSSSSPAQLKGTIKTASELLASRIEALNDQWRRGMETDKGYPNLLSPKSRKTLTRVSGERVGGDGEPLSPSSDLKSAVENAGWKYEPDKYEYRMLDGKIQRRLKNG